MSATGQIRDSKRRRLSEVPADLNGYVKAVFDGAAIEIELTFGRAHAVRLRPDTANVARYGCGGGFVGTVEMSRPRLKNYLEAATPDDPLVRRGSPAEVWPF